MEKKSNISQEEVLKKMKEKLKRDRNFSVELAKKAIDEVLLNTQSNNSEKELKGEKNE